jgi:voltage-gated potassium channel
VNSSETIERVSTLNEYERWTERPMQILGFGWLALLILELTRGLSPLLAVMSAVIWGIFIIDFAVRLFLARSKTVYLRRNWLVAISLAVPAFRVLRVVRTVGVLRAAPVVRGVRLVRVVGSLNRGMSALGKSLGRRGLGYVVALTILLTLGGAAGMYAFERDLPGGPGLPDYPTALWWTAMIMTTFGTSYWPQSAEGRALCLMLAVYAFGVWGYLTASLATYFVGQDANADDAELAGRKSVESLRADIADLRADIRALRDSRRQ